jgi:hypothetical protein
MIKKLKEIRTELQIAVISKDWTYVIMQINNLDTIIHDQSIRNK